MAVLFGWDWVFLNFRAGDTQSIWLTGEARSIFLLIKKACPFLNKKPIKAKFRNYSKSKYLEYHQRKELFWLYF